MELNILNQPPVFKGVCAHLSGEDKIRFSVAVGQLDHYFLVCKNQRDWDQIILILIRYVEHLSHTALENLTANDWSIVSDSRKLSEEFMERYSDRLEWDYISKRQNLSNDCIQKFKDRVNWSVISQYQRLDEDSIRKYEHRVNWSVISKYQRLSEDFIREFSHKIDWRELLRSRYAPSSDFIAEMLNKAYQN